jgi:Replication-relaxation
MGRSDALRSLSARLTDRDRTTCQLLLDHRVMTSEQLGEVAFGGLMDRARHRLVTLRRLNVLAGFRPFRVRGSAPYHYVLGEMGAVIIAAAREIDVRELGYRVDHGLNLAHSQRLNHLVGVNDLYAALVAAARRRRGAALTAWWSERRCAEYWGALVRPDAYGRWQEQGVDGDFFVEYDRGTEPPAKVAEKLSGYADLASASRLVSPVLMWLPSERRESEVRRALVQMSSRATPVLTGRRYAHLGPADAVWLPLGAEHRMTLRIALDSCAREMDAPLRSQPGDAE